MMLNIKSSNDTENVFKYLPIGIVVGIVFLLEIYLVIKGNLISLLNSSDVSPAIIEWYQKVDQITNVETLGLIMYTYYFYFFLAASIILFVSMIGAITLTLQTQANVKRQQIFQQVSRDFEKAVFLTSRKND